jgi:dolichol-phosphate mannosyltransferase
VSVLIPTFNEAKRLGPCLKGLLQQGPSVQDIVVVDGNSSDGTVELAAAASAQDPRVRIIREPPLPNGWIGKVWALQHGLEQTASEWVMNVDADIDPEPGLVAAAVNAAEELSFDVVSFSPCFAGQTAAEQWLQSALLVTLVYRSGAPGDGRLAPERVMANGQCFLARRSVLVQHGGYTAARSSFSDDVTLARHLAKSGARVGFLDGSRLYRVRSYNSLGEMWREWGRSIDLKDATGPLQRAVDCFFLALVQGAPLLVCAAWAIGLWQMQRVSDLVLLAVNVALLSVRTGMLIAITPAYAKRSVGFWVSPTADVIAVVRVVLSMLRRPTRWRGRRYPSKMVPNATTVIAGQRD